LGEYSAKICTYIYANAKMRLVETIPGMGGEVDKGEQWRG
jgi:hypothetical protein